MKKEYIKPTATLFNVIDTPILAGSLGVSKTEYNGVVYSKASAFDLDFEEDDVEE